MKNVLVVASLALAVAAAPVFAQEATNKNLRVSTQTSLPPTSAPLIGGLGPSAFIPLAFVVVGGIIVASNRNTSGTN